MPTNPPTYIGSVISHTKDPYETNHSKVYPRAGSGLVDMALRPFHRRRWDHDFHISASSCHMFFSFKHLRCEYQPLSLKIIGFQKKIEIEFWGCVTFSDPRRLDCVTHEAHPDYYDNVASSNIECCDRLCSQHGGNDGC